MSQKDMTTTLGSLEKSLSYDVVMLSDFGDALNPSVQGKRTAFISS